MKNNVLLLSVLGLAAALAAEKPAAPSAAAPTPAAQPTAALASYAVNAQIDGLFANVHMLITFANSHERPAAGDLALALPEGAYVWSYMQDVRKLIDEETPPQNGQVHVDAIPARGSRTVRLEYVVPLECDADGNAALILPLPHEFTAERAISLTLPTTVGSSAPQLDGLGERTFQKSGAYWRALAIDHDVTSEEDVIVTVPRLPDVFSAIETCGPDRWFAASLRAPAREPEKPVTSAPAFRILWDASARRSPLDVTHALHAVRLLPHNTYYSLVVYRDQPEEELYFSSRRDLLGTLTNVVYRGGSDLAALAATNNLLRTESDVVTLLFTDGVDAHAAADIQPIKALALVSGRERQLNRLRAVCGGRVLDLTQVTDEDVAHEILHPSRYLVNVVGPGIDRVQGIGQPAAGRVTVLGRLTAEKTEIRFDYGQGVVSAPIALSTDNAREGRTLARLHAAGEAAGK